MAPAFTKGLPISTPNLVRGRVLRSPVPVSSNGCPRGLPLVRPPWNKLRSATDGCGCGIQLLAGPWREATADQPGPTPHPLDRTGAPPPLRALGAAPAWRLAFDDVPDPMSL